jgi:hypothetical protein
MAGAGSNSMNKVYMLDLRVYEEVVFCFRTVAHLSSCSVDSDVVKVAALRTLNLTSWHQAEC